MLKMGFGMAAVTVGGFSGAGIAAGAFPPARLDPAPDRTFPSTAEITGIKDGVVALRTKAGEPLSALLSGFPQGFKPRVGDLVGLAERNPSGGAMPRMPAIQLTSARCVSPASVSDPAVERQLSAVPLCSWRRGIPTINRDGRLSIQGVALVESVAVRDAAMNSKAVAICTLDSTLETLQVLETRA
jgi:hypothetical protein